MNDLISREAAWEEIKKVPLINPDRMAFKLQQALWDIPAVEVVPVVRCKDCVRCLENTRKNKDIIKCKLWHILVEPTAFCSRGERKE